MTRSRNAQQRQKGSALLAALCFCVVLGIALASYMSLCSQTLQLSNRNSQGVRSLELAETGMEDVLWALNKGDWGTWTRNDANSPRTASKTIEGFSFGNGVTGTVSMVVENYDGLSSAPEYNDKLRKLTVTGSTFLADGTVVTRKLQAAAQPAPLFVNAIASTSTSGGTGISFANSAVVDSYDSRSGPYNIESGPYGDIDADGILNKDDDDMDGDGILNATDDDADGDGVPNISDSDLYGSGAGFSAVVSSETSISLMNAEINGYVTVPTDQNGNPRLSYTSGVRLAGPTTSMSTSVDSTRISSNPYQPAFELKTTIPEAVTELSLTPTTTTIGNPSSTNVAYYHAGDLMLQGSQVLIIAGPVVIAVSGNFTIQETAKIVIDSTPAGNGSLQVFLTSPGSELLIGGNGIENKTKRPRNVGIFDAASAPKNNPQISTTADFHGAVYVPNSDLALVVSSNLNIYGSLIGKNVNVTGAPNIHYDVDLRRVTKFSDGIETPFVISAWQEIIP
jgi:hypothetical protein